MATDQNPSRSENPHGPERASPTSSARPDYPGQRFGRPERGKGSLATVPWRILALIVDWVICLGISHLLLGSGDSLVHSLAPSIVFWVYQGLLVGFMGHTLGHFAFGMQVQTIGGEPAGFAKAFLRSLLVTVVIPILVVDEDGRGLQDRAVGTLLVRIR
ncbi:RDD family protein [Rothia uropygialis]|uniref:RDD family protein n=1 Tax=Kocuria sp. 36 TaxID=1415402 RepID=UPI00101CF4E0|nr:RDD family protein [Kocuria sp. 36]